MTSLSRNIAQKLKDKGNDISNDEVKDIIILIFNFKIVFLFSRRFCSNHIYSVLVCRRNLMIR